MRKERHHRWHRLRGVCYREVARLFFYFTLTVIDILLKSLQLFLFVSLIAGEFISSHAKQSSEESRRSLINKTTCEVLNEKGRYYGATGKK